MSRPWGRLYGGTHNHRKIKILAQRLPALWPWWYVLIDLAIEVDDGGWIYVSPEVPYTFQELAKELRIRREDHVKTLCKTLEELKLITISDKGILMNSFSERNFDSDNSTPRVQKYREKQKAIKKDETPMKRFGNVSETDQNRTDTEQIQNRTDKRKDIAKADVPSAPALIFFSCQFFDVDFNYRMKLAKEYPALNDDLLKAEFSKMEDWIIDNRGKKKFKANGHLGNPRLFIKNWLNRVQVDGQQLFGARPKGSSAIERARRADAAKGEGRG